MKKITFISVSLMIGLGGFAQANSVFSPAKGIVCDKKSNLCADKEGISLGLTKQYLGSKAENKLQSIMDSVSDMDLTTFTLSNGLSCDTNKKICKKSKWDTKADPHWTNILFGNEHHNKAKKTSVVWTKGMKEASNSCKVYLTSKYNLPMAAYRVVSAKKIDGGYVVSMVGDWDEPRIEEKGICTVKGDKISYRRISK